MAATVKDWKPPLTHAKRGPWPPTASSLGLGCARMMAWVISTDTSSTVSLTILLSHTRRCQVLASCVMLAKGP